MDEMVGMEEVREQRKFSFWKWTCGGCLVVVALIIIALIVLWYSLKSWDKGESAWERMPPSTIVAVEIHDVRSFLANGIHDPGVQSLLTKYHRQIQDILDETSGKRSSGNSEQIVADLVETFDSLQSYFTILSPNMATIGAVPHAEEAEEYSVFIMFRPPTWMRLGLAVPENAPPQFLENSDTELDLYILNRDGWLVIATSNDLAQEIADHWGKPTLPLGPRHKGSDAYLAFGMRYLPEGETEERESSSDALAPSGESDGSVMFNNPFASDAPEREEASTEESAAVDAACRFVMVTDGKEWKIDGEILRSSQAPSGALGEELDKALAGAAEPSLNGSDLAIVARAGETLRREGLDALNRKLEEDDSDYSSGQRALLQEFLCGAWLENAEGSFCLTAKQAVAPVADGVPPLPVFTLAWLIRDDVQPRDVAANFTNSLTRLLDEAKKSGHSPSVRAVMESVTYRVEETDAGLGAEVTVPPVILNSAKPVWLFPFAGPEHAGWLASDPVGVVADSRNAVPDWRLLAKPGKEEVRLAAAWQLSSDFREDFFEWFRDRLDTLPRIQPEGEEKIREVLDGFRYFLTVFPRGRAQIVGDRESGRLLFRITVPAGEKVVF